ncbi:hypothetical protein [Shewanella atlantica]|uniref:Uncharacterized protein n=1 Tax=Shewanella atlantica TaxID=271099 RepID=A0A431VV18_9GAMM|nr:hypothetical protein [Shewanella atlantica]RTR27010.1 hypothetical protein EKG39_21095 [Shewanella atlantica]
MKLKVIIESIRNWYLGEWRAYENEPGDIVIMPGGRRYPHWTATLARVIIEFLTKHAKWGGAIVLSALLTYLLKRFLG